MQNIWFFLPQAVMTDLKTHLYAKFGDAINFEAGE